MILLGIDPGIADLGFGVVEKDKNNNLRHIAHGSIKTPAGTPFPERLWCLYIELIKIIDKYKPSAVAIEELFFSKNVKTAMTVSQARGVALLALQSRKVIIKEFKPNQIKQAVTAYGGANKAQVQKMVKMILNLKEIPKPDDAADALAMAITLSALPNIWLKA